MKQKNKDNAAIFLSFSFTFLLLTAMLILMHTNYRVANIQEKTLVSPSDCYVSKLTSKQAERLKEDTDFEHVAVNQVTYDSYECNQQTVYLQYGDKEYITMTASLLEGRMPEKQGEIVAEKWALLNLGVKPEVNQQFKIKNQETNELVTVTLTGILSDMSRTKQYGVIELFTPLAADDKGEYVAYLKMKPQVDYESKLDALVNTLDINKEQIKTSPAKEDYREIVWTDAKMGAVILMVCMVVFYGIFRITLQTRKRQYGILRAIGMKRKQLYVMLLKELYRIYAVSVPVGMVAGWLIALFVIKLSGDKDKVLYFYNQRVAFVPVVPIGVLLLCVVVAAVLIGIIGSLGCRTIVAMSPAAIISDCQETDRLRQSRIKIRKAKSKTGTIFRLAVNNLVHDRKISIFASLTICVGVSLFIGLAYQSYVMQVYREDTKEMWYLNGQYEMSMAAYSSVTEGVSRECAEQIQNLPNVTAIKTASGMPVRVIAEENRKRNKEYYDAYNARMLEYNGYQNEGNDGTNQVYKSILYGYNETALQELEKYVIDGKKDLQNLAEDEIVLSVLRTDDTKQNENPGYYREGTPLMEYQAGDTIQITYRKDLHTDNMEYEKFVDKDAQYVYKTYKVAAIVSFVYMKDANITLYPLLITKDSTIAKIAPKSRFQCMYIDGDTNLSYAEQTKLEQQLIEIGSQNQNIVTRSMITEIEQNEMFYRKQMVYIYGIAIIVFLLVLINIMNNMRYRMQSRTRVICMLRAMGMSVAMIRKMTIFENVILALFGIAFGYLCSVPVVKYLYAASDMKAMGHPFHYCYGAYVVIAIATVGLCTGLSVSLVKEWRTRKIV